jgi:hypothetical protein
MPEYFFIPPSKRTPGNNLPRDVRLTAPQSVIAAPFDSFNPAWMDAAIEEADRVSFAAPDAFRDVLRYCVAGGMA